MSQGICDRNSRIGVKFGENTATGCIIKSPSSCFIHTPLPRSHLLDDSLNTTAYIASFGKIAALNSIIHEIEIFYCPESLEPLQKGIATTRLRLC